MFFDAIAIVVGFFALVFLFFGGKMMVRSGWVLGWLRGMSGVVFLCFAAFLFLVALDLRNYYELTKDKPIAQVSFKKVSPQTYSAILLVGDSPAPQEFVLKGDQWQIDARILRWSGVIQTIGGKPGYRLDRISGRYQNLIDEMQKERSVHNLANSSSVIDLWLWLHAAKDWVPGVEASYGSATYVPMADGALFQVGLSNSGLVATPLNDSARAAVQTW